VNTGVPIVNNKWFYFANFEYAPLGQGSTAATPVRAPTVAGYALLDAMPALNAAPTTMGHFRRAGSFLASAEALNVGSRGYAEQKNPRSSRCGGKVGWWRGSKLHDCVESMQEVANGIRAAYQITTSGTSELFFYPYLSGIMAACSCQRS